METLIMNDTKTKEASQYALVKGDFSPSEALETLNYLITGKINFYQLKNFSQQVRFEQNDETALKRIEELNRSLESIKNLINETRLSGKSLRISSDISIEVIP